MISLAYRLYGWTLRRQLAGGPVPRHVAMVMDGNRRWAREQGYEQASIGYRYGGEHLEEVLGWCAEIGIRHVTVFVASTDNLRKRDAGEMGYLMTVIEDVVAGRLTRGSGRWRLHVAGRLDALPESTAHALKEAVDATAGRDTDSDLTVAVGYDGREEVTEAVRSLLTDAAGTGTSMDDLAQTLTVDDIADRLYTSGRPDPDLVIRTSGEQRVSAGFLMWQAAHSELYFCDVYWPGFRRIDFLRALRSYAQRRRRNGG